MFNTGVLFAKRFYLRPIRIYPKTYAAPNPPISIVGKLLHINNNVYNG